MRSNLAAIGIELEIREFSYIAGCTRASNPDEPWDLSHFGWVGEFPDPAQFVDQMYRWFSADSFLDRTGLGPRMRAANKLEVRHGSRPTPRWTATSRAGGADRPVLSAVHTDFFSARIGCQVEHPLYGIDLAALCVRV